MEVMAKAVTKLQDELKDNRNSGLAMVAQYLFTVINKDAGFAEDACDAKHNILDCWKYIVEQARKNATNGAFMECGDDPSKSKVFEWAEDYYRKPVPEKKPAPVQKKPSPVQKKGTITQLPKFKEIVNHYKQEDLFSMFDDETPATESEQDSIWDL